MRYYYDFIIVGSGIAGLTYALKVAEHGKVSVITKSKIEGTATWHAQGGIAAVMSLPDSIEKHVNDTMSVGCYIGDEDIIRLTITESKERILELINWGVVFDKDKSGDYDLTREGGHTEKRIFHAKDSTGEEIEKCLYNLVINHSNIDVYEDFFALELITQHHLGMKVTRNTKDIECYGLYAFNQKTNNADTFLSKITFLATGGCGAVYEVTSNPLTATGDGVALAYRAKVLIENMEFIQFHPTSLYHPSERPAFLITEAMRGEGAILKTIDDKEFMHKYDKRGSLAPRDITARAIDSELIIADKSYVYLDCRHLGKEFLQKRFPKIFQKCKSTGVDISRDMIPVAPAAHYQVGGIKVNKFAQTNMINLYAAGECASTGLHGANRLASNSLLEAIIFSHRAYVDSASKIDSISLNDNVPDWKLDNVTSFTDNDIIENSIKELNILMTKNVGIVRTEDRLEKVSNDLEKIYKRTEEIYQCSKINTSLCELRNMINVAYLIIKMAQARKESIGLHYLKK